MLMWLELGELGLDTGGVGRDVNREVGRTSSHWTWCQRKQLGFAPNLQWKAGP